MSQTDIKGKRISTKEAKQIINDVLATSKEGETFVGATAQGAADGKTFDLPKNVEEAQAKEVELRNSGNAKAAGQFANGFLGTIAQKLIYQTILTAPYSDDLNFIERFRGENIEYGIAKEYVVTQMSGYEQFDPDQFIPTSPTKATVVNQVNAFLNQQGQLNTNANAFMNKFCISIQTYATKEYMLSDVKLQEFIQTIRDSIINGAKLFLYNKIMDMITNGVASAATTPDGSKLTLINGTAANMFDACIEICTHIKKMTKLGNKYQLIQSTTASENVVRACDYKDLTWIWSIANDERATRGIKSQLYHYKLWDSTNAVNESNVYTPANKITLPDLTTSKANNYPTDTGTAWIDDNTVVVLENKAVEFNLVWEKMETQYYTNNMTLQITYNLAGMVNFIKTMRGFVYKNANLNRLP